VSMGSGMQGGGCSTVDPIGSGTNQSSVKVKKQWFEAIGQADQNT